MTAQAIASQVTAWLRTAIALMLLVSLAATLLRSFGISLPIRSPDHVTLAYLAGAYWLSKA